MQQSSCRQVNVQLIFEEKDFLQKSIVNTPRKYTMCHMNNWKVLFVI